MLLYSYWQIGREILERQEGAGWGAKVIDRLSFDLRRTFPNAAGFPARNLKYMRAFAGANPEESFVQQAVAQIPGDHNTVLLDKLGSREERERYASQAIARGWSRNLLIHQMGSLPTAEELEREIGEAGRSDEALRGGG